MFCRKWGISLPNIYKLLFSILIEIISGSMQWRYLVTVKITWNSSQWSLFSTVLEETNIGTTFQSYPAFAWPWCVYIYIASSLQKLVTAQIECESECARLLYKVLLKVTAICFELPGIWKLNIFEMFFVLSLMWTNYAALILHCIVLWNLCSAWMPTHFNTSPLLNFLSKFFYYY